jgi:hypothetical protein
MARNGHGRASTFATHGKAGGTLWVGPPALLFAQGYGTVTDGRYANASASFFPSALPNVSSLFPAHTVEPLPLTSSLTVRICAPEARSG